MTAGSGTMAHGEKVARATEELLAACAAVDPAELTALANAISQARRVVCHGVGREGLMMRALAMRCIILGSTPMWSAICPRRPSARMICWWSAPDRAIFRPFRR